MIPSRLGVFATDCRRGPLFNPLRCNFPDEGFLAGCLDGSRPGRSDERDGVVRRCAGPDQKARRKQAGAAESRLAVDGDAVSGGQVCQQLVQKPVEFRLPPRSRRGAVGDGEFTP